MNKFLSCHSHKNKIFRFFGANNHLRCARTELAAQNQHYAQQQHYHQQPTFLFGDFFDKATNEGRRFLSPDQDDNDIDIDDDIYANNNKSMNNSKNNSKRRSSSSFDNEEDLFASLVSPSYALPNHSSANGGVQGAINIRPTGDRDFTGMRIIFLGTCAMRPSNTRNVTSIALQLQGETWIFDCGEGTQHQCLRYGLPYNVSNVFITHLHGDHVMGLPGLATQLNVDGRNSPLPLQVFGPYGLRRYLHTSLSCTSVRPFKKLVVSELLPRGTMGDNGIYPDSENVYQVLETDTLTVKAKLILHSVPCFGYVIEEKEVPGTLNVDKCKLLGLNPGREYKDLKNGKDVTLPNGTTIYAKDVVGESQKGRKIVILGDTCDASSIAELAKDATIVIHESTLPDQYKQIVYKRGHACPSIAGSFAKSVNAKKLFITHFGGRYADDPEFIQSVMVPQAQAAFGNLDVTAAEDFLVYNVPRVKPNTI